MCKPGNVQMCKLKDNYIQFRRFQALLILMLLPAIFFYSAGFALPSSGFTHNDSLRGSDNPAKHYDITYYRLHLQIEPDKKKISGANEIYFTATDNLDSLQIDLFKNYEI